MKKIKLFPIRINPSSDRITGRGESVEACSMRETLARMIQATTSNNALRDDLMQEALVHVWLMEARRPGQTRSWYLQSCKFHLRHYLESGRSIDSGKRRNGQLDFALNGDGLDTLLDLAVSGASVLGWVSARDLISVLSRHLMPQEKAVLNGLADGLGTRELGRNLKLSHTTVIKHRRKIANLLARLEKLPFPKPGVLANGTLHPNGTHISNWPGLSNGRPSLKVPHAEGKC
jgi:DNA-directed RNA polymerase specialized sigma24 family protein